MGGKSTFLRQTALISLMAQIGSFVPTKSAFLPIVDRIFTRVGASDNLAAGESTFMVEMKESSEILRHATDKSLIVLDEIGRGTATYDGLSLAWAIAKFIHDKIGAKTLFATHYHELTKFSENLSHSNNLSVKVAENSDGVVFLYEIQAGAIDKSYGIEVAKIAGLPHEVVLHATETLAELEKNTIKTATNPNLPEKTSAQTLFDFNSLAKERHFARLQDQITKIKNIPINEISPINALLKLQEIKENLDQIDNFDQ
jgi:DNA mismatch repair protein MutS